MKKIILAIAFSCVLFGCTSMESKPTAQRKVAVQMYSLNKFTLEEALEKVKPLKLDAVECYPGQRLSAKYPNSRVGFRMNAEERAYMKKLLKDAGLRMVNFGVINSRDYSGAEIEKICAFVKEMGGERVLTESAVYFLPMWSKAASKYGITVSIHHHATDGAPYWDVEYFKRNASVYGNIKYNPDPGHWSRSGIDPVKALKSAEGYIDGIHFKDQREFNNIKNQPAPFGKGVLDVKGMLAELDRQGFDGYFVVEYETNWMANVPEIAECVNWLRNN